MTNRHLENLLMKHQRDVMLPTTFLRNRYSGSYIDTDKFSQQRKAR